ncbi:hypothetical protein ONZ45_g2657 [Pleurotus djamor]|nr:hypothetical protein ONZ45_g2657 [Pleurotus djamor]
MRKLSSEDAFSSTAMTRLPAEILLQILTEVATSDDYEYGHIEYVYLSVTLPNVCKRWRQVALNIPSLWHPIDLSDVTNANELTLIGPLPALLRLTCSKWTKANIRTWSISVMDIIDRIWEIDISDVSSTPIFDTLSLDIERPASDLRVFKAAITLSDRPTTKRRQTKRPPLDQMGRFLDRPMPHLRVLQLTHFPVLPWNHGKTPRFSNLTTLSLDMGSESTHGKLSQILPSVKASSSSLTCLVLCNVILDLGDEVEVGAVKLPVLEDLAITTPSDSLQIAQLFDIPPETQLKLVSECADISSLDPEDIIRLYKHVCPETLSPGYKKYGGDLSIYLTKNSITVDGDTTFGLNAYFRLVGSSQADHSAALLSLAMQFSSLFHFSKTAQYAFHDASMDCSDWGSFVQNLHRAKELVIHNTPLTTMRNFMTKCDLGNHAPKMKKLHFIISQDEDDQNDSFPDEDAELDALHEVIVSLRGHLHRHIRSYDSLTTVGFDAEPFSAFRFQDHFHDSEDEFDWAVEDYSSVEGTRGKASFLKFGLGNAPVLNSEDEMEFSD